jgi:hypothetical protein
LACVEDRLKQLHEDTREAYTLDCLTVANELRALLVAQGRVASLLRLRKRSLLDGQLMAGPLTPLRYAGRNAPTWTTHYACYCEGWVYDALFVGPVPIGDYSLQAFGERLTAESVD